MTWPPRSIISIEEVDPEDGGGVLILCDCGTATHLVLEWPEGAVPAEQELAFTCGGCHSVNWCKIGPVSP